jgi:AraC-like DNA-binding protein
MKHFSVSGVFPDPSFPITVGPAQLTQPLFEMHTHDFTELVLITGGAGVHRTEADEYPVTAGDVFVLRGATAHGYRDTQGLRMLNVMFEPEGLLAGLALSRLPGYTVLFALEPRHRRTHRFESRLHLGQEDLAHARGLTRAMMDEQARQPAGYEAMIRALLLELVVFLCRRYGARPPPAAKPLMRVGEAIRYMELHYREPISLEELAGKAHLSANQFLRLFREAVGTSPIDHLIRLRIGCAAEMLRHPELRITEIAHRAGFSDSNYFSRQFRRIMGKTPRQYRRGAEEERREARVDYTDES